MYISRKSQEVELVLNWTPKLESLSALFAKLSTGGITPTGPAIREATQSSLRESAQEGACWQMMNDALTSLACSLAPGTAIQGKWNGKSYRLLKQLGKGANGIVYLAEASGGQVALKISGDSMSVTSEVNVLKSFSKARSQTMGPSF